MSARTVCSWFVWRVRSSLTPSHDRVLRERAGRREPDRLEPHDLGECVVVAVVVEHCGSRLLRSGRDQVYRGGERRAISAASASSPSPPGEPLRWGPCSFGSPVFGSSSC